MPLYEYVCPTHGHPFEKIVPIQERDMPQPCSECIRLDHHCPFGAKRIIVPSSPPHVIIH